MQNSTVENLEKKYKESPSIATFHDLYQYAIQDEDYSLSEFLLSNDDSTLSTSLRMRIRADAFVMEGRNLEASHFCERWRSLEPSSWEAWRLTGILAGKTANFNICKLSIGELENLNAPESAKWLVATIFRLVFAGGNMADLCANTMLKSMPNDPAAIAVALNAAIVTENEDLLYQILLKVNSLSTGTRSSKTAELLIRRKLIATLRTRM